MCLENKWEENYKLAKKYYEHYGCLNMKTTFITNDGINYDKNGIKLGSWINYQKSSYHKGMLKEEYIEKLLEIGIDFETRKKTMKEILQLLKNYYNAYGHINVPLNFKTNNGFDYDEDGYKLGTWLRFQVYKHEYGTLPLEIKKVLDQFGFCYDVESIDREKEWENIYELAKIYYEHYNNLQIPRGFKTKNGYEYDEEGIKLGAWVNTQRYYFNKKRMTDYRVQKLNDIGMIWSIKIKNNKIDSLCLIYNIDKEVNKEILEDISYKELKIKILFLQENGIDIMENGVLHEIFSMSNINMKSKYGVSIEDLFKLHSDKPKKRKKRGN